jgi:subfamily B ATP-binding cassette protein MsbA
MFYLEWKLACAVFIIFPLTMVPMVWLGQLVRRVSKETQLEVGQLTSQLGQVFQGIRYVKAYNAEEQETKAADQLIYRLAILNQKATRLRSAINPIMETLGGLAIAAVMVYAGYEVMHGRRTIGDFFAFITTVLLAYQPLRRVAGLNSEMQQGLAAAERVFSLIDSEPSIVDSSEAVVFDRIVGQIDLINVCFAYAEGSQALSGISLTVSAGQTVALVGPSGAGKSTVLNLIPRFYDVDSGSVLIDGHDVRSITICSLREQIALVSQDITLFDETVRANIAYGRIDATDAEVEAAARQAAAHDFIRELPQGYATLVGEQGVKLSGGQRLKNAPILLLDEATSALDSESERLVQEALFRLKASCTTLVIAHRLSTVMSADFIYVLDQGKVVEKGTHTTLVARNGFYSRLWSMQTMS